MHDGGRCIRGGWWQPWSVDWHLGMPADRVHRISMRPSLHRQLRRLIIAPLPDNSAVDLVKNMLLRDKSLSRKAKKA